MERGEREGRVFREARLKKHLQRIFGKTLTADMPAGSAPRRSSVHARRSSVHALCLYLRRMCVHVRVCLLLSVWRPVCLHIRKPVFLPLPTNSSKRFVQEFCVSCLRLFVLPCARM
jgi:hypothetical protein